MSQCEYWWLAGGVEWCDLMGSNCRCGGWETACAMREQKRKPNKTKEPPPALEADERPRHPRNSRFTH